MILLVLVRFACGQAAAPPPLQPIEPVADKPFLQEYREPFIVWEQAIGEAPVSVAVDASGRLWSAGPWGVRQLVEGKWQAPKGDPLNGPAFGLAAEGDAVWVAAWDGLYRVENGKLTLAALKGQPLGLVRLTGGKLIVGGPKGLWERQGDDWKAIPGLYSRSLTDVAAVKDRLWIATQRGLFELRDAWARRIFSPDEIASGAVRALAVAPDGRLWIGSSGGIDVYQDGKRAAHIGGAEGLPCTEVWRLKFDSHGVLWVATARGLGRFDRRRWTWRDSLRWLPADSVWDVALAADGTAYVATTGGLSILKQKEMTLAEKANVYEKLVRERHVRPPGLVEHCNLKQPGDLSNHTPTDTDNDGLFTGLYVGAEAYRYRGNRRSSSRPIRPRELSGDGIPADRNRFARLRLPHGHSRRMGRNGRSQSHVHAAAGGGRAGRQSAVPASGKPLAQEPRRQVDLER